MKKDVYIPDNFEFLLKELPKVIERKLEQLKFLNERPDYHPEPSVYIHIKTVTERLIDTECIDLILTGLFHDICKFDTVRMNPKTGHPTMPGHDRYAFHLINENQEVRDYIKYWGGDPDVVAVLCDEHMRIKKFSEMRKSKQQRMMDLEINGQKLFAMLKVFTCADDMLTDWPCLTDGSIIKEKPTTIDG